jgi:hypothetical protein
MSSGPSSRLESIFEEVRRLQASLVETTPGGNGNGPNNQPLLDDVVVLDHLSYLTTSELREYFKKYYGVDDLYASAMYNYVYENKIDLYKYKKSLLALIVPFLQRNPSDLPRMLVDLNNLLD